MVKVRDDHKDLQVRKIETIPVFSMSAWSLTTGTNRRDAGLYHLYVEVPQDAPTFRLPPNKRGRIHIELIIHGQAFWTYPST